MLMALDVSNYVFCSPERSQQSANVEEKEKIEAAGGSVGPTLPPRKKKHVVHQQKKEEIVEQPEVEVEGEHDRLKHAAEAALAATAAAAAAGNAEETISQAEVVSDIIDDQIKLANNDAIEAVVELVEAEAVVEEAVEDANRVLEESKKAAEQEVSVESPMKKSKVDEEMKEEEQKEPHAGKEDGEQAAEEVDVINTTFTLEDLRGKTLSGKAKGEDKSSPLLPDEEDSQYEQLDDIPHPELSFAEAPGNDDELTPLETKIRDLCLRAHKLIKDNNKIKQGLKEQQAAMDLCLGDEGRGKVRPTLVAACAFSLSDMLVAEKQINETKVALAVAMDAIKHADAKGGPVRAYMNYAYVLRGISKHRSARDTYKSAYEQAKADFGLAAQNSEQVKYEYTAYLAKIGRTRECVDFLVQSAEDLKVEADRLDKESDNEPEKEQTEDKKADQTSDLPGMTPLAAEEDDSNTKKLTPGQMARHYAMRNLLNAAGVLDTMGEHEEAQETLANALELAINVHGENSVQHMNALYAVGVHCRARGAIDEAIQAHEAVLNIMDQTISVYEPDLLQNRIAILRDTAVLYDQQGHPEIAIDYAEGAAVNAQTLAKIMAQSGVPVATRANMMEPFWVLLAELKNKIGDTEGAAAARREALKGKLNLGMAARGGRSSGAPAGRSTHKRTGASTRAGGRRV